jgi:hypothetical protein
MSTVKQKQAIVTVEPAESGAEARRIIVHRMTWKAQRAFLRKLADVVTDILRVKKGEREVKLQDLFLGNLASLVASSDELISILCLGSTGMKLEEFDALESTVALEVLKVAMELNFDDETKNSFAGIRESLAALMPAEPKTTSSATSTPT